MLVLGLLGIQGQYLGRLQNSPLTSIDWSTVTDWKELYFKIHVPYLLTVGNRGLVRVLEKHDFITFYRNPLHYGMALTLSLSVLALLTLLQCIPRFCDVMR